MKLSNIRSKIGSIKSGIEKSSKFPFKKHPTKLRIDESLDPDYDLVKIKNIGLADPLALQGVLILQTEDGREFPISAFSGEVAQYISNFFVQKRDTVPSIYNMIEQLCEHNELYLVKVKLYESGKALRANLYFTGKKDLVLRNFRASDAIALATFYNIPILIRNNLLTKQVDAS
jgi:hypothetical protein